MAKRLAILLTVLVAAGSVRSDEKLTGVVRQEPSDRPYTTKFSIGVEAGGKTKRYPVMVAKEAGSDARLKLIESSIQKTSLSFTGIFADYGGEKFFVVTGIAK